MGEQLQQPKQYRKTSLRVVLACGLALIPAVAGCDDGSPKPGLQQEPTTAPDSTTQPKLNVFPGCLGGDKILFNADDQTAYTDQGTIEPWHVRVLPDLVRENNVVAVYVDAGKTVVTGLINLDNIECGN